MVAFLDSIAVPSECTLIRTAALISIQGQAGDTLRAVNVGGVRAILNLCARYGRCRLVHVSSVHAISEAPERTVMTEPDHHDPKDIVGGYAKTRAKAAQMVLDAARFGAVDAVVVYPSGIIGP